MPIDSFTDVKAYGFYGRQNEETTWTINSSTLHGEMDKTLLPAPALNIAGFYFSEDQSYGYDWFDPQEEKYPFRDPKGKVYAYDGKRYNATYITEHGDCKPSSAEVRS